LFHKSIIDKQKTLNYKSMSKAKAIILMGVSGCGKTSVGQRLSQKYGWHFFDGDDYQPQENIAKMAAGIPLEDDDRFPWLETLNNLISEHLEKEQTLLLASSALKQKYRDQLAKGNPQIVFVYLKGDFDLIFKRMKARAGHYMKAQMLRSQFEALEEPTNALTVEISQSLDDIVNEISALLDKPITKIALGNCSSRGRQCN
jgi:gluconokinase